ncbi:hypothetical protein PMZ80_001275 [Knufia obscura]|uniref:Meiotic expression up-regulated protein 6 PH domain-containing protein n=1 Tax=Knufia obscura TaxID=1635080 RepID=A0ABR0S2R3_9EURO|nr:hypothetical protein PMZ80_001275 [Knufia obscura]
MSVETPKVEETTPAPVTKPVESTATPAGTTAPATTEPAHYEPPTDFTLGTTEATPATETKETKETTETAPVAQSTKEDAAVEATPATEGTLGYKAPGLLKQFRYVKHFFWFSEEPLTQGAVDSYVKSEKADVAHHNAAWAQETGKGVMFFAKRAEDKATPSGMILLPEATAVTKVGTTDFSFKVGNHTHKFEAATAGERDSWVVAIQKIVEESKDLKADVTGRESYKKTVQGFAFAPAVAGASTSPVKHDTPKKSLDANTATAATTTEPKAVKADSSSSSSDEEAKKAKKAEKDAAKKERSQSRKRNSVFGLFGKKDEDKKAEKAEKEHEAEVKQHDKEVKKHDHEVAKEQKRIEAEHKKEEAKAEHDTSKATEAAEAAAIAAAPAAVAASVEKKEHENTADKPVEQPQDVTTPPEKKNKRASVFGGFFGKNKVTSPSVEKSEKEVGPIVPAKDETSAVSETAPKLDEPIDTKPLDTAAVTAPVDDVAPTAAPAAATPEESRSAETVTATESTLTPRTEKKSFLAGLMKKQDKKEEPKHEAKTNEEAVKEVAPDAAAPESAIAEPTTETPVKEAEAPKEERPAREKRRTSLFGSLGTLKRKTEKSPEPSSVATDGTKAETKREKSPMPSKLGGLFRKPSRAQKPAEEVKTDAPAAAMTPDTTTEAPKTTGETGTPANATIVEPKGDSQIVGDVVPDGLHSIHDVVTKQPEEVKSTA